MYVNDSVCVSSKVQLVCNYEDYLYLVYFRTFDTVQYAQPNGGAPVSLSFLKLRTNGLKKVKADGFVHFVTQRI